MHLSSVDFDHQAFIPEVFTCQGLDINPELAVRDVPEGTQSLALIIDDPDAPAGTWVHWVVFNIPSDLQTIAQNTVPGEQGLNDFGRLDYGGPCPPSGTHRYFFKIYALDKILSFDKAPSKQMLESAMQGHIIGQAEWMGKYSKY
ncbi:MAG: YbhB/YbcL family Raf kinase inhibitor-like protein [Candidatus Omnitrophica bacterium]|nr:YbhB/YbcL family Raf kinase inhibitor-like protein [Candidatus Omnitrophota bacterium]